MSIPVQPDDDMPTEIENDADIVLRVLAEWLESGDPEERRGHSRVTLGEISSETDIGLPRLMDASTFLHERGLVELGETMGGASSNDVSLTTEGRLQVQRRVSGGPIPSPRNQQWDVFLGHSSFDDALAAAVQELLKSNGVTVFATPASVPTGNWEPQIEEALKTAATLWLLLTPAALRESVWTHHEFGYFYGFRHGAEVDAGGHGSRYLYTKGTELRGLYAWIQGTEIASLEDPVAIASAITEGIGRAFQVPSGWEYPNFPVAPIAAPRHPQIEMIVVNGDGFDSVSGDGFVRVEIKGPSEPLYHVSVIAADPEMEIEVERTAAAITKQVDAQVRFRVRYRKDRLDPIPALQRDFRGREYSTMPGPKAPEGTHPLFVTFEDEAGSPLAAVVYYTVQPHAKGYPEMVMKSPALIDWVRGQRTDHG